MFCCQRVLWTLTGPLLGKFNPGTSGKSTSPKEMCFLSPDVSFVTRCVFCASTRLTGVEILTSPDFCMGEALKASAEPWSEQLRDVFHSFLCFRRTMPPLGLRDWKNGVYLSLQQLINVSETRGRASLREVTLLLSYPVVFSVTEISQCVLNLLQWQQWLWIPWSCPAELYLTLRFYTISTPALLCQAEQRSPSHCWVGHVHSKICHREWELTSALVLSCLCAKHSPGTCSCYDAAVSLPFRDAKCHCRN